MIEAQRNSGDSEFMRGLFNNMGIVLSLQKVHLLTRVLFTVSWFISYYRYVIMMTSY